MSRNEGHPLIFDIHHFALDDGPGIRTTVFFKGCPLACKWCQNPESINIKIEISFNNNLCIKCGDCQLICPKNAISLDKIERIDRSLCNNCSECVEVCSATALKSVGKYYSVDDLVAIIEKDRIFYDTSEGGVTFSGGEPTLYMDYVKDVMIKLKKRNIHIAVQTSGMFELSDFKEKLLPYISLIFYDIKFIDPELHKKYTGKYNKKILDNFQKLVKEYGKRVIARVPLVPNITATNENLFQIARFLKNTRCAEYKLLPYNLGWISKRILIGKPIPLDVPQKTLNENEKEELIKFFQKSFSV